MAAGERTMDSLGGHLMDDSGEILMTGSDCSFCPGDTPTSIVVAFVNLGLQVTCQADDGSLGSQLYEKIASGSLFSGTFNLPAGTDGCGYVLDVAPYTTIKAEGFMDSLCTTIGGGDGVTDAIEISAAISTGPKIRIRITLKGLIDWGVLLFDSGLVSITDCITAQTGIANTTTFGFNEVDGYILGQGGTVNMAPIP